jgi:hypothetical protein
VYLPPAHRVKKTRGRVIGRGKVIHPAYVPSRVIAWATRVKKCQSSRATRWKSWGTLEAKLSCKYRILIGMSFHLDVIEKGYFPVEIPPAFSASTFAGALRHLLGGLNSFSTKSSRCAFHSIPRLQHHRRLLGIPNPLHQLKLDSSWRNTGQTWKAI